MDATTTARTFERNDDGSMIVPAGVQTVSKLFCSTSTQSAVYHLIDLVGEDGAIQLGEFVESLNGNKHNYLLGLLAEGWRSSLPLRPVIDFLLLLDGQFTLRALAAQRICTTNPSITNHLLPFYRATSGLEGIGA